MKIITDNYIFYSYLLLLINYKRKLKRNKFKHKILNKFEKIILFLKLLK